MELIEYPELTAAERSALVAGATCTETFSFMGNPVRLAGNAPAPLESFSSMYQSFRSAPASGVDALELVYALEGAGPAQSLTILSGARVCRVREPSVIRWAFGIFTYLLLQRIRSHFLVHAGCVARGGQGIIISADSRMGKTTLVSHLVQRGMGFLSDEVAPIDRRTGIVEPYPRRLSIRPGPADALIAAGADTVVFETPDDFRTLVDVRELGGAGPARPVPLHAAVFLSTRPEGAVNTPRKFDGTVRVGFTRTSEGLEQALHALAGVSVTALHDVHEYPVYLFKVNDPESFLPRIKEVAEAHGVELTELRYDGLEGPDFDAEPRLVPIPAAAGVIELVKKMPGAFKKGMIEDLYQGKLANLVAAVGEVVKSARFYRLSPGRLTRMIEVIETLP